MGGLYKKNKIMIHVNKNLVVDCYGARFGKRLSKWQNRVNNGLTFILQKLRLVVILAFLGAWCYFLVKLIIFIINT